MIVRESGKPPVSQVLNLKIHEKLKSLHDEHSLRPSEEIPQRFKIKFLRPATIQRRNVAEGGEHLLHVIDTAMMCQQNLVELADHVHRNTRLQLLFIFAQNNLAIVFNTYNLVMFFLRWTLNANFSHHVGPNLSLLFYGYPIVGAAWEILWTALGFAIVHNSFRETLQLANKMSIYVKEEAVRSRLAQFAAQVQGNSYKLSIYGLFNLDGSLIFSVISGTTTYIIILIQYGGQQELIQSMPYTNSTV